VDAKLLTSEPVADLLGVTGHTTYAGRLAINWPLWSSLREVQPPSALSRDRYYWLYRTALAGPLPRRHGQFADYSVIRVVLQA